MRPRNSNRKDPVYHAAGIVAFALKPQEGEAPEIVILMIAETRSKREALVLNIAGGKQVATTDLGDPVLTAVREFQEETAHAFEFDKKRMEQWLRHKADTVGLPRCRLERGSYFLMFCQIPYIEDVQSRFEEQRHKHPQEDSSTQALVWVPLAELIRAVRNTTALSALIGSESKEFKLHSLLSELLEEENIAQRFEVLQTLSSGLPVNVDDEEAPETSAKTGRKRKRLDESSGEEDGDERDDSAGFALRDKGNDRGRNETTRIINLHNVDWEALIAQRLAEAEDVEAKGLKKIRKAVVATVAEQVRERLRSTFDLKLEAINSFQLVSAYVSRSSSRKKRKTS